MEAQLLITACTSTHNRISYIKSIRNNRYFNNVSIHLFRKLTINNKIYLMAIVCVCYIKYLSITIFLIVFLICAVSGIVVPKQRIEANKDL